MKTRKCKKLNVTKNIRLIALIFGIFFILFSCQRKLVNTEKNKRSFNTLQPLNGITLGMHSKDLHYDYGIMVQEIKETGAEWISLQVSLLQQDIFSNNFLTTLQDSAYWWQLEQTIEQCKAHEMKILLNPVIHFRDESQGNWRGQLTPEDITIWFENYTMLLTKFAEISDAHHVDAVGLGSELCSIETETENWNKLIQTIKNQYAGMITYSLNWDNLDSIQFYEQLDFIGISCYYSLSDSYQPDSSILVTNWQVIKDYILHYQENIYHKPIVFTELGYASQDGISTNPWNYFISKHVDLEEQKACYEAFVTVWQNEERFGGALFYDWFGLGGENDLGYTFKNKPALEVIKLWFKQQHGTGFGDRDLSGEEEH